MRGAILGLALVMAGCTSSWGPLAVSEIDGQQFAWSEGVLVMTDRCTFLEDAGRRTLLVWPQAQTSWNLLSGEITFKLGDRSVDVRNGQRIAVGGGGWSEAVSGQTIEELVRSFKWVVPPAEACLVDSVWFVGAVVDPPLE